jgi:tRNA-dihydrouridine synthase
VIQLIRHLIAQISLPLTAKIRLFVDDSGAPDIATTVEFVRQLESTGIAMVSVHGRQQQQDKAGSVNIEAIRAIVSAVKIPVLANGGIQTREESDSLVESTGATGAMIGQGLLNNPRMFDSEDRDRNPLKTSRAYLEIFQRVGGEEKVAKRHLFCFFEQEIKRDPKIAERLKDARSVDDFIAFLDEFERV